RLSTMTAPRRADLEASSDASSPATSLTSLFGGAYRLLDSVAIFAPCAGGNPMIIRRRKKGGKRVEILCATSQTGPIRLAMPAMGWRRVRLSPAAAVGSVRAMG